MIEMTFLTTQIALNANLMVPTNQDLAYKTRFKFKLTSQNSKESVQVVFQTLHHRGHMCKIQDTQLCK